MNYNKIRKLVFMFFCIILTVIQVFPNQNILYASFKKDFSKTVCPSHYKLALETSFHGEFRRKGRYGSGISENTVSQPADIFNVFCIQTSPLNFTEIEEFSGLQQSTVRKFLGILMKLDLVIKKCSGNKTTYELVAMPDKAKRDIKEILNKNFNESSAANFNRIYAEIFLVMVMPRIDDYLNLIGAGSNRLVITIDTGIGSIQEYKDEVEKLLIELRDSYSKKAAGKGRGPLRLDIFVGDQEEIADQLKAEHGVEIIEPRAKAFIQLSLALNEKHDETNYKYDLREDDDQVLCWINYVANRLDWNAWYNRAIGEKRLRLYSASKNPEVAKAAREAISRHSNVICKKNVNNRLREYDKRHANEKYGEDVILTDVEVNGVQIPDKQHFHEEHYTSIKELVEIITGLKSWFGFQDPKKWRLIITTDSSLTSGNTAAVNLSQKISSEYPENTLFIHTAFFDFLQLQFANYSAVNRKRDKAEFRARQLVILYHNLISQISHGLGEDKAISYTASTMGYLNEICEITLMLDAGFYDDNGYAIWTKDYRLDLESIRKIIFLTMSNLSLSSVEDTSEVLRAIGDIRWWCYDSRVSDSILVEGLSGMAEVLEHKDAFIDALFIEKQFAKLMSSTVTLGEYEWYCQDYGMVFEKQNYCYALSLTRTVFSIYKEFFGDDKISLQAFVKLLAQELRDDHTLQDKIDNQGKLYAYLANLANKGPKSKIKCIVLDCDGVLWGGILAEDGSDGIKLGGKDVGMSFVEFQRRLLTLKDKGFMLAVCSRNESHAIVRPEGDILNRKGILERGAHPEMVLTTEDFVTIKANLRKKADSILEIAQELGIGLDSIMFIDDNPVERELVRRQLPDVNVPELPDNPDMYVDFLEGLEVLRKDEVTDEDRHRTDLYRTRSRVADVIARSGSFEDALVALGGIITVRLGEENTECVERVVEIHQRTNQFNLNPPDKRYSKADIIHFLEDPDYYVFTFESTVTINKEQKSEGIVGLIILKKQGKDSYIVDTFCISCRVMQRPLEHVFMPYVVKVLKKLGAKKIYGLFTPTDRNSARSSVYKELGFVKDEGYTDSNTVRWKLDLEGDEAKIPYWITIRRFSDSVEEKAGRDNALGSSV